MRRRIDRDLPLVLFGNRRTVIVACVLACVFSLSINIFLLGAKEDVKLKLQEWQMKGIVAALDDSYSGTQQQAFSKITEFDAKDLKAFPRQSEEVAKRAIEVVRNSKQYSYQRVKAAQALEKLGKVDSSVVQVLSSFINDSERDSFTATIASQTLINLGKADEKTVRFLLEFVRDIRQNRHERSWAVSALGDLNKANSGVVQVLSDVVKDPNEDSDLRIAAARALGKLHKADSSVMQILFDLLKDPREDPYSRITAAEGLGELDKADAKVVQILSDLAKDFSGKFYTRVSAAEGLRKLGKVDKTVIQVLFDLLKDPKGDFHLRVDAAEILIKLGKADTRVVQVLSEIIKDPKSDSYSRIKAAQTLGEIKQLELNQIFAFINATHDTSVGYFDEGRFNAYFYSKGAEDFKILMKWVGRPEVFPDPEKLTDNDRRNALKVFQKAWESSKSFPKPRAELARAIASVTSKGKWKMGDALLLEQHYRNLNSEKFDEADTVKKALDSLTLWRILNQARNVIAAHLLFWTALIFAYPKYSWVQAVFFWNPWVRKIGGAGYIGFLLAWVPFLRRKLFEPFKFSLIADARLTNFDPAAYFPESHVILVGSRHSAPLNAAIPAIQGQSILEGSSGLGKSMFLRHLAQRSDRIVVFLPARKCENGVIEAIQAKLHGQAQDAEFLKNLIYSGAIDICIDGLNEVSPDTRAKISQFVESYFKGNIILTTQPIEWIAPTTAKIYELQPLQTDQIETFLVSRQTIVAPICRDTYAKSCHSYLTQALNPDQFPEELAATQRILSNPMDLTIVAQMIALGKTPNLFRLQEQQYQLMAEEYRDRWNQDFPLKKFSEALYQLRLNDEKAIPADEFLQELLSMEDEKYKMVVSRQWKDPQGEPKQEWYCRHDKIMEFFIVQTFLGDTETAQNRLIDHMGDSRFRGVYFLLATLLPIDRAADLREELILYAAESKDHTVSDTFVQLFHSRAILDPKVPTLTKNYSG